MTLNVLRREHEKSFLSGCAYNWRFCLLLILLLMSVRPAVAEELTYWVSKNFSETPNANMGINATDAIEPFAPQVIDLSGLKRAGADADVDLCFDNRPIYDARHWKLHNGTGTHTGALGFCERYDEESGIGFFSHPKRPDRQLLSKGLLVSRLPDNRIVCEAVFTTASLISLLSYRPNDDTVVSSDSIKIYPYGAGQFLFVTEEQRLSFYQHLNPLDQADLYFDIGGTQNPSVLSLNHSWSCLLPAFKYYWELALDKCMNSAAQLREDVSKSEIYLPLVDRSQEKLIEMTKSCHGEDRVAP